MSKAFVQQTILEQLIGSKMAQDEFRDFVRYPEEQVITSCLLHLCDFLEMKLIFWVSFVGDRYLITSVYLVIKESDQRIQTIASNNHC